MSYEGVYTKRVNAADYIHIGKYYEFVCELDFMDFKKSTRLSVLLPHVSLSGGIEFPMLGDTRMVLRERMDQYYNRRVTESRRVRTNFAEAILRHRLYGYILDEDVLSAAADEFRFRRDRAMPIAERRAMSMLDSYLEGFL